MYYSTIGLEIHIELATQSKMFCGCKNNPDEKNPNINICPVCTAQPGTLPVINKEAVKKVIKTALALNCEVTRQSFFERKNYFYPDLPKGYQISQYAAPLSRNGYLDINAKKIRIRRVHLEEDTARLIHSERGDYSLVDFNRAGIPLMELVTEPDIESADEAREFIKELQLILRYLGVSDANMEKGEMRAEVNISLINTNMVTNNTNENSRVLGTKVEIKNLNSLRAVERSIEYEIKRQAEILEKKEKVIQETMGWDAQKEITFPQREKEEAHDYRYFPEPDLPPLEITEAFLQAVKAEIPELPSQRRQRFKQEYGLGDKEIELYVSQKDLGEYFEKVVSELQEWVSAKKLALGPDEGDFHKLIKLASNYISTDLQALLKGVVFQEEKLSITAENFAEFLSMLYRGEISSKIAKAVLKEMFGAGKDPSQIIEDMGLQLVSDEAEIEKIIKEVVLENQKAADDYKKGKETALQFLIGQVMTATKGRAEPEMVQAILRKILSS